MYNHAPTDYDCPFCRLAKGDSTGFTDQNDIVYRGDRVTAFVSLDWKVNNPGHVLVIPNDHVENIYDLASTLAADIHAVSQKIALAFKKVYGCMGISIRQHNEPAGGQDVWHYHAHVFPRYNGDNFDQSGWHRTTPEERRPYSDILRGFLRQM